MLGFSGWPRKCAFAEPSSVRFDVGELDHLGPFLGFIGNQLAEISGRASQDGAAKTDQLRPDLGIGEREVDFGVERLDNLNGCVLGTATPNQALD